LARMYALREETSKANKYLDLARQKGKRIADPEDRSIFMDDLEGEPWFGLG